MKKLFMIIMTIGIIVGVSGMTFAYPNSVTIDSDANGCAEYNTCDSGYSVFSTFFEVGVYTLTVGSGEFQSGSIPYGVAVFPINYYWGMNIYQPGTSTEYVLGDYAPNGSSPGSALSANFGTSIQITQSTAGNLLFYVRDDDPRDNFGTLTANVAVVPEPVSSTLFVIGGAVFAGRRFRKRNK